MAGGKGGPKGKPGSKEKHLAASNSAAKEKLLKTKTVAKEKRAAKLGNVSKLYTQNAQGTSVLIGRKRDRPAMVEPPARRTKLLAHKTPRGRPPVRLSSPLPAVSSSESEQEQAEEPLEEDVVPSDDDYQDRGEGSDSEEEEERHSEEEEEDEEYAVPDEDLLTHHPLDETLGKAREGKVYLRGPSSFPDRKPHGMLDVTADA